MKIRKNTVYVKNISEGDRVKLVDPSDLTNMDSVIIHNGYIYVDASSLKINEYVDTIQRNGKTYATTEVTVASYTDAFKESGGEVEVMSVDDTWNDATDIMVMYITKAGRHVGMWISRMLIK